MVALISNGGLTSALDLMRCKVLNNCERVAHSHSHLSKSPKYCNHNDNKKGNKYTTINHKEFTMLINIMSSNYYLTFILKLFIHSHGNKL